MIQLAEISRKYGDFTAVDQVSFTIGKGEIVGLLGHNGAGKTTILKMLTGYLEPTSGTITIDGLPLHEHRSTLQAKIGYLPENCPVYPEMSVLEYLDYGAALHGVSEKQRPGLIRDAVYRTALQDKAAATINTLSRGFRQRTGVAQAILHKPEILILDEPTNGLDPSQIQQMRTLIKELSANATVIVSTHILQEVQAVCDRVIIIRDGRMALDSPLNELTRQGRLLITVADDAGEAETFLANLHGVDVVTRLAAEKSPSSTTFALTPAADVDRAELAAMTARSIHEQGWSLYGMHFEARNLETVFAEISG